MRRPKAPEIATCATAPTRVCLGGEDLDWLGGPSLLAAIDLRVTVEFQPRPTVAILTIRSEGALPAYIEVARPRWTEPTSSELELVRLCWQHAIARWTPTPGGDIAIASEAPPSAGLATSATICVAALHALAGPHGHTDPPGDELVQAAYDIERWLAGRPVGPMDFVPAVFGGTSLIQTESEVITEIDRYSLGPDARFLIVDTRTPRDTGAVIAWKRQRLAEGDRDIRTYARRIADLVTEQTQLLANGSELAALGETLDRAHTLLRELMKVSTPVIDACVTRLRSRGALGAKLTGTGLGGCVVGLTTTEGCDVLRQAMADLPVSTLIVDPADVGVTMVAPVVDEDMSPAVREVQAQ